MQLLDFLSVGSLTRKFLNFVIIAGISITLLCSISPYLYSETTEIEKAVAEFDRLGSMDESSLTQVGVFGGSARAELSPIKYDGAQFEVKESDLHLKFEEGGFFQITPNALKLPSSWQPYEALEITFNAKGKGQILLEIFGPRTKIQYPLSLEPGLTEERLDIREIPILGGITGEPLYLKITADDKIDFSIEELVLLPKSEEVFLVDKFGQRALVDYPEKVDTLDDLADQEVERRFLKNLDTEIAYDRYGGYLDHSLTVKPNGFFQVAYADDRWWLITPEGNPFFSLGLNGVRIRSTRSTADVTRIEGREWLFEALPAQEDCPECFYEDPRYFSFYCWNLKRKGLTPESWKIQTYQRLQAIGFNTIGNWSDTIYYNQPEVTFTYTLDTRKNLELLMPSELPDVFNPAWEAHVESVFKDIERFKDESYLLGFFVDNEMAWRQLSRMQPGSHTYETLNGKPLEEIKTLYAEKYFQIIHKYLNECAPNHLYLGCRFTKRFEGLAPIAKVAGRYIDVLSVNIYSIYPLPEEMNPWFQAAGKPILIGEHHIPPNTLKQNLPHYPVFDDSIRYEIIENYVLKWAEYPFALGSHWYQFKDQEVAGRKDGGENQPVGLITIADQLNLDMAEAYYQVSQKLPSVLFNTTP